MRNLLDTRTVYGIGNGVANIYEIEDGFEVEVVNNQGATRCTVAEHDAAWKTWLHPFALGLDIPARDERPVSVAEHKLYVALETAEAGDRDAA